MAALQVIRDNAEYPLTDYSCCPRCYVLYMDPLVGNGEEAIYRRVVFAKSYIIPSYQWNGAVFVRHCQ